MLKRIITVSLCIILAFGISAYAANTTGETEQSAVSEETPMQDGGRQGGGGRGRLELPPDGTAPGEMRDMPEGEGAPPESNENNTADTSGENTDRYQRGGMNGDMGGQGGMNNGMREENTQNTEAAGETGSTGGIAAFLKTYNTPITAVILLIFAFVFVIFYKRKRF